MGCPDERKSAKLWSWRRHDLNESCRGDEHEGLWLARQGGRLCLVLMRAHALPGRRFDPRYLALALYWVFVGMMFNSSLGSDVALLPGVNVALYVHLLSILGGCLGVRGHHARCSLGHLSVLPRRATVGACVLVQSASSALCHIFGYSLALTGALSAIGGVAAAFPLVAWGRALCGARKA